VLDSSACFREGDLLLGPNGHGPLHDDLLGGMRFRSVGTTLTVPREWNMKLRLVEKLLLSLGELLTTYLWGSMGFRAVGASFARAEICFLRGYMGVTKGLDAPTTVDYDSEGRRFESCRARPSNFSICRSFCCSSAFSAVSSPWFDAAWTGFICGPGGSSREAPGSVALTQARIGTRRRRNARPA